MCDLNPNKKRKKQVTPQPAAQADDMPEDAPSTKPLKSRLRKAKSKLEVVTD